MSTIQNNNVSRTIFEGTTVFLCTIAAVALYYQSQQLKQTREEKETLQQYADTARNFANRIQPDIPDVLKNFEHCDKPDCMTCRAVRNGNQQAQTTYSNALQTLKINPATLQTLQKGPTLGE